MTVNFTLNWVVSAGYYVVFVSLVTDLSKVAGVALHMALGVGMLGLIFGLLCTLMMGQLSDILGRRRVLVAAAFTTAIAVISILRLADAETLLSAVVAQLGLAFLVSCFLGTLPPVFVSLYPAGVRCSVLSVGYNISIALCGGTAPLVATYLVKATGWSAAPGIYLAATALICLALRPWCRKPARIHRDLDPLRPDLDRNPFDSKPAKNPRDRLVGFQWAFEG